MNKILRRTTYAAFLLFAGCLTAFIYGVSMDDIAIVHPALIACGVSVLFSIVAAILEKTLWARLVCVALVVLPVGAYIVLALLAVAGMGGGRWP